MNARITLEGELTIYRAAELKERLIDALAECDAVLEIDLSGVTEIDTAGLQVLMLVKREASRTGNELRLLAHSRPVIAVMELLNVAAFFGEPLLVET